MLLKMLLMLLMIGSGSQEANQAAEMTEAPPAALDAAAAWLAAVERGEVAAALEHSAISSESDRATATGFALFESSGRRYAAAMRSIGAEDFPVGPEPRSQEELRRIVSGWKWQPTEQGGFLTAPDRVAEPDGAEQPQGLEIVDLVNDAGIWLVQPTATLRRILPSGPEADRPGRLEHALLMMHATALAMDEMARSIERGQISDPFIASHLGVRVLENIDRAREAYPELAAAVDAGQRDAEAAQRRETERRAQASRHAIERELKVGGMVMAAAIAPDGQTVAIGCAHAADTLFLLDRRTGRIRTILLGDEIEYAVQSLAFLPDGRLLVCGTAYDADEVADARRRDPQITPFRNPYHEVAMLDADLRVIDVESGQVIATVEGPGSQPLGMSMAAAGAVAVGAADGSVLLWPDGIDEPRRVMSDRANKLDADGYSGTPGVPILSPDGNMMVVSHINGDAYGYDIAGRQRVAKYPVDRGTGAGAFSPDGERVTIGRLNGIMLFEADGGELLHALRLPDRDLNRLNAALWLDKQRLITADGIEESLFGDAVPGRVRIWDTSTGQLVGDLLGHDRPVQGLAIAPDRSILVSGDLEGRVLIWRLSQVPAAEIEADD